MRNAYGAHRRMTPQQKARNVAESILAHGLDTTDAATWTRYGLQGQPLKQAAVEAAIAKLQGATK